MCTSSTTKKISASGYKTAFQSKRRLSDGAIVGYEALLRITLGNLSINPEAVFAPGVELSTQLALTQMVLDDALQFGLQLQHAGTPVPISINDFGGGTTSLERLFDLPLTELRIDKEIFWKCGDGREPAELLREVVHYCEERNITSAIEGIETAAHRQHAIALGAQYGQGYLWDRPNLYTQVTERQSNAWSSRAAVS